jgi:DNA-binding MarR family transcriptional regulator
MGDAASEAWACITQMFTSEENQRRFVGTAESLGLTPRMLRCLYCLVAGEPTQMRALVEAWQCDPSWVTAIVDELEQRGLVERRVDTVDRRAKTVTLTPLGEKSRAEAVELLSVPPPGIAALSPSEQRTLRDLVRKATAELPPRR